MCALAIRFSKGEAMPKRHKRNGQQTKLKGVRVNRKFKDSLFRMVFREKTALLSLYNAINQSNYQNPEELEITTIEDAIYIGVKNDVSFLINDVMNLYEAQSSENPNMPLRGLLYFAQLYQSYVARYQLNIYSSSQQKVPTPLYIVLYNGTKPMPDISEYRLSDAFDNLQVKSCLECVATVLNINAGCNQELMSSCRLLYEYAYFVECVRSYLEKCKGNLEYAVDCAVNECIRENVLKEFLIKHKAEVRNVILTEYDAKQHIEAEKSESYREGEAYGRAAGKAEGKAEGEAQFAALSIKLLSEGKAEELKMAAQDQQLRQELYRKYGI